ncbi:MAG TPA: membrane protein insertase YidC [Candidatus Latescibacteria bacterium]|nr:membrane protein insertase YidC [Candidatus Latescibacterota bacterium]
MDKNTILAFLLIGMILILMPYYQRLFVTPAQKAPPQEKVTPKREERTSADGEVPPGDLAGLTSARRVQGEEALYPLRTQFVPRSIPIENDLVRGRISTKGGVIESWRLKKYKGIEGEDVELIPEGAKGLVLSLHDGRQSLDLSEVEFVPDKRNLILTSEERGTITFVAHLGGGKRIEKEYKIRQDEYVVEMDVVFTGFDPRTKCRLEWRGGINTTEKNIKEDLAYTKAYSYMGGEVEQFDCKNKKIKRLLSGKLDWFGVRSKYFLISLIPTDGREGDVEISGEPDESGQRKIYNLSFESDIVEGKVSNIVYLGPIEYNRLKGYNLDLDKVMDFGWPIVRSISKIFLRFFVLMHKVIPNYGVVIIIFSMIIKILVYPLTKKSYQATADMQRLQPKIAALQQKYKNDRQRLNRELMRLYKEHGVNPMGGCLPILLQMPIFFALYKVFRNTIELRQAEFVLWLKDLSQPDPYYVLPILMGATTFIQQRMTVKDPKQKAMSYIMPVILVFIFLNFSSGLVLYWTMFNVLSSLHQWFLQKK